MNATAVEKPTGMIHPLRNIRDTTPEKNLMNVMNVEKPSLGCHTSLYTIGLIQERSPTNVTSVGKNSITNQPSIAISGFTGEGM